MNNSGLQGESMTSPRNFSRTLMLLSLDVLPSAWGWVFLFLYFVFTFLKISQFPVILMSFTCFICSPLFVTYLTCESGDCGTEACEWGVQKTASQNSILCCGLSRHNGEPFCGLDDPVIHFKGILKTSAPITLRFETRRMHLASPYSGCKSHLIF